MSLLRRSARPAAQGHSRAFMLAIGLIGVAAASAFTWIGLNAPNDIPGRAYYVLEAELREADNVTAHSQVRIAGRLVGQVLKPRVENGRSVIDLQLDGDVGPLRSDTTARVRPRSPIGVRFVELVPGRDGRLLRDGDRIGLDGTSAAVPLDSVLGTLDARTRERTKDLISALGAGAADRGLDLNATLDSAGPALRDAGSLTEAIAARRGAAGGFVRGSAVAADAADPVRRDIAEGFAPARDALRPFGRERDAIGETLAVGARTLGATRSGLARTSPLLREAAGLARDAMPMLRAAPASLRRTTALLRDGREGIAALDGTLDLARRAVNPTLALLDTVDPVLGNIDGAIAAARPIVAELAPRRCDLLLMLRNFESMLAYGTQTGNYLRFNVLASPESIAGQQPAGSLPGVHSNPYPAPCAVRQDRERLGGGTR